MYWIIVVEMLFVFGLLAFVFWDMWRIEKERRKMEEMKKAARLLERIRKLAETDEELREFLKKKGFLELL
jgi:hypothetical protein